ncbi:MAG: MBL fold metallo-hydrolase [Gemmatimonadota bacterium]|nr:MBL fold metallo-hydrolase [Gemmatimonadota bacterium]
MKIHFWGAARTVTGSMHLVETNGRRILLDCGMYHGRRKEAYERNRNLPFDAASIDAVVLSHAHIDHSGNLPTLIRSGYRGEIFCTSATRDLAALLLLDSARIQESDVARVNRRRKKEGETPFEPLYTEDDAVDTLDRFVSVPYDRTRELFPGVAIRFIEAGHMLGSASVVLDVDAVGERRRLLFSGDIGRAVLPILRDPETIGDVDYVIMESTYGSRVHDPADEARGYLLDTVERCRERGGKLLIPSFAVGRTQELVYRLNQLWTAGELPPIDVYVDTPLGVRTTEVYRLHPECYDREMLRQMEDDPDGDPLGFERLTYIKKSEESRKLNDLEGPAIIISPSGMCEGGRILHHLIHHGGKEDTTILFVGYQAEGTLGRRILEGAREARIYGSMYPIRARIRRAGAYSAHGDRDDLTRWIEEVRDRGSPKQIFLVHGEEDAAFAFMETLEGRGFPSVHVPERGSVFELA